MQVVCQAGGGGDVEVIDMTHSREAGPSSSSKTPTGGDGDDPGKNPWRERALAELL